MSQVFGEESALNRQRQTLLHSHTHKCQTLIFPPSQVPPRLILSPLTLIILEQTITSIMRYVFFNSIRTLFTVHIKMDVKVLFHPPSSRYKTLVKTKSNCCRNFRCMYTWVWAWQFSAHTMQQCSSVY